ncbi:hypothetical protein [Desulfopila aestuarii]|uniref:hypothetical protein n=1 Tax=Desulfopila aestuarii TaxID=231440 RepID=UPI000937F579|nr:hypothetical protein [Desulfopila aestuarii]
MKSLRSLIVICLLCIPALSIALEEKDGVPMTLVATPQIALPGMSVKLSGTTVTAGDYVIVNLLVTPPPEKVVGGTTSKAPTPVNLTTKCDAHGAFSVDFIQTKTVGTYTVSAKSPVGTGTGSTTFQVQAISDISSLATSKFEELGQAFTEYADTLEESVNNLPASDERKQLLQSSAQITAQLTELNSQAATIRPHLKTMSEALDIPPEELASQPAAEFIKDLSAWTIEADQQIDRLKSLLPKQKAAQSICEMIHIAGEGMRMASNGLAFYGKGMSVVINLAIDKGIPLLLNQISSERCALWDASAKGLASATQKTAGMLSGIVGLLNDAATLYTDVLLNRYCGVYSGPIKATMSADFKHLGQSYWKYSTTVEGTFTLRFPKNTPGGGAVRMTGEVFGNATSYTFWEDIEKVMEVPAAGQLLARIPITPGPFPPLYKDSLGLGQLTNLLIPSVFYIPLEAQMEGDNVAIKFMEPVKEIESYLLKNQLILVYMAFGLPVPAVKYIEFPVNGAHFILSRGMRNPAEITISGQGKQRAMKKTYQRTYEEPANKEFTIDWVVDLDATNPPKK